MKLSKKTATNGFEVKLPVFNTIIHVIFTDDIRKTLKEYDTDENLAAACLSGNDKDQNCFLVQLILPKDIGISMIAHECFHAVYAISENCDFKLGRDSEEVFAYMLDNLVDTCLEARKEILGMDAPKV